MELVDRNLVLVQGTKSNGAIKTFSIHDVLRELYLEIATKERLFLNIPGRDQESDPIMVASYKKRRIFTHRNVVIRNASNIRSFLSFYSYSDISYRVIKFSHSWMLLMVLDLQHTKLDCITAVISYLVHLRYPAMWYEEDFPSSLTNLWSLQTFIIRTKTRLNRFLLPETISNLVNLRHFRCNIDILFPQNMKPMNLLTISSVILGDGEKTFLKCVPSIKKLSMGKAQDRMYDFKSLTSLEVLKISRTVVYKYMTSENITSISFPASLKKLTLEGCHLPWSFMSKIQSLPKLEVLNLLLGAFVGLQWDAGEEPFQQLKVLKLCWLDIRQWEASSINFPRLKQLVLKDCNHLKEIPPEIGYIPTLECIKIESCNNSFGNSVYRMQKEQHDDGNLDLKFIIREHRGSFFSFDDFIKLGFLEASDVPTDSPPVTPARQYMHDHRTWTERRSKSV